MSTPSSNSNAALEALQKLFPDSSRRTLRKWLKYKRFQVDGIPIQKETDLLPEKKVDLAPPLFRPKRAENIPILFEDRYFIVIDKPKGLLSVPLDGPPKGRHALGILRSFYGTDRIFPVHRIDRETSGLLLFARGGASREKFKSLFETHDLTREYFAIVEGKIKEDQGTWESHLRELPNFDVEVTQDITLGKNAITHFKVVHRSAKYTYLHLSLETGRKHQIRVHCKAAGFPVLGDARYGSSENPIRRMCLHARRIEFVHPFTNQTCSFESPLPPPFKKLYTKTI